VLLPAMPLLLLLSRLFLSSVYRWCSMLWDTACSAKIHQFHGWAWASWSNSPWTV
jgi:hypothetical protein